VYCSLIALDLQYACLLTLPLEPRVWCRSIFGGRSYLPVLASFACDVLSLKSTEKAECIAGGSGTCRDTSGGGAADALSLVLTSLASKSSLLAWLSKLAMWLSPSAHKTLSPDEAAEIARRKVRAVGSRRLCRRVCVCLSPTLCLCRRLCVFGRVVVVKVRLHRASLLCVVRSGSGASTSFARRCSIT
jgi:hypothetical protein